MPNRGHWKHCLTNIIICMYSKEQLANILRRYEYPNFLMEKTVERLNNMQPEIKVLFDKWLTNGDIPKDEINGYTFEELTGNKFNFTPINAFVTLNWLLVDSTNAIAALESGTR